MMRPITSSMFSHIGYDPETLTMSVQYLKTGDIWEYKNILPEIYAEAEKVIADPEASIGTWFHKNIRGKYDGAPLVPEVAPESSVKTEQQRQFEEQVIPTDNDYYEKLIDDEEEGLV